MNHSGDALGYAAECARMQATGTVNWSPHHLLYHPLLAYSHLWPGKYFTDILPWAQAINAVAAGGCLAMLYLLSRNSGNGFIAVLLAGSAFGVMRFATENETYMLPILFSLWGSWFLFKYRVSGQKQHLLAGFLALSVAILFHQIHVWWWLAAAWTLRKDRTARICMTCTVILVAAVYALAAGAMGVPWWRFPFSDALSGTVELVPGVDHVKFTVINLIRTWVQVHGSIPWFVKASAVCAGLSMAGLLFLVSAATLAMIHRKSTANDATTDMQQQFYRLALLLHLIWAFYSSGNAEFMVMIPFLAVLSFPWVLNRFKRSFILAALGMLAWNSGTALLPNRIFRTDASAFTVKAMQRLTPAEGKAYWIGRHKVQTENYLSAMTAIHRLQRDSFLSNMQLLTAPADRGPHTRTEPDIDSLIRAGALVFTDCLEYPEPVSRSTMLTGDKNSDAFKPYRALLADSFTYFYGKVLIYRLQISDCD